MLAASARGAAGAAGGPAGALCLRGRPLGESRRDPSLPGRVRASTSSGLWAAGDRASAKAIANWVTGELVAGLRQGTGEEDPLASKATPESVASLAGLVEAKTISHGAGKQVLAKLVAEGGDPAKIVESEGLAQISDSGELEKLVDAAIEAEPEAAAAGPRRATRRRSAGSWAR